MSSFLFLLIGIALLCLGGEALIRGALTVSRKLGVSPLLSGLIIVGFGTSAPELVVSVDAALNQQPDLAVGNVVGSNIGNILLILGLCAIITPLSIRPQAMRRDAVMVVVATGLFVLLAASGELRAIHGVLLLVILGAYLGWAYRTESRQVLPSGAMHQQEGEEVQSIKGPMLLVVAVILLGLLLLIAGSRLLLTGAVQIASSLGVSDALIGLTLVAVGTSLPELSISVIAALRRHADVAVGNILGSNIFNILGILGVSAILQPLPLHPRILEFDQWLLLATALLLMCFLYTGRRLNRLEGGILLAAYGGYLAASILLYGS